MDLYTVPQPMKRPDYVFYHTPTPDEMRQRAVKAMNDFLSIQWRTHTKIVHSKVGAVRYKRFIYEKDNTYGGLPYTDAGMGLFQFLEYYDHETGRLKFYGDGQEFNLQIGGTCACGVCWSLSTVCSDLGGNYINFWMTPKYGYLPVGGYKIPEGLEEFRNYHTSKIIADTGIQEMMECYGKIQPADAVSSSDRDHTMMCIDYPHVERNEDGTIDPEKSYVMVADQRGGTGLVGFYDERIEDDIIHHSGRTSYKCTFAELLRTSYIPLTTPEFMGLKPYERAKVTFSDESCATREQLIAGSVCSNYPMSVIKLVVTRGNGYREMLDRYLVRRVDPLNGKARCFPLENMAEAIRNAEGVKLELEVTTANGEVITPVSIDL